MLQAMAIGARITVGLGNTLTQMGRLGKAVDFAKTKFTQLKSKAMAAGRAMKEMAKVGAALGLAAGFMTAKAASFEQKMSGVQAVLLRTKEEMAELNKFAQELGATTAFSAGEAAEGMENMARAGFNNAEIMKGLPAILDAAAADQMSLAQATDVVASSLRAMGMEADQTAKVADVFALASARSNTNIAQLGEGMRYVGPVMKQAGVSLEDTTAALMALSDANLKASMGGTGLKQTLLKLTNPSKKATKAMAKYGISVKENADGSINLGETMKTVGVAMKGMESRSERLAVLGKIFGSRAAVAVAILGDRAVDAERPLSALSDQLRDSAGSAKKMAGIRLDNLKGDMTLMASAFEGLSIALMGPVATGLRGAVVGLTNFFTELRQGIDGSGTTTFIQQIGVGMKQAFDILGKVMDKVSAGFKALGAFMQRTFGEEGAIALGKYGTMLGVVLMVLAPIVLAIALLAPLIAAIGAVGLKVIAVVTLLAVAFGAVGTSIASSDTASRGFFGYLQAMGQWLSAFWTGFSSAFMEHWNSIREHFAIAFETLGEAVSEIFAIFSSGSEDSETSAMSFGYVLGQVAGVIGQIIGFIVRWYAWWAKLAAVLIRAAVGPIFKAFKTLFTAIGGLMSGTMSWGEALKGIGSSIIQVLLWPFKFVINGILGALNALMETKGASWIAEKVGIDISDITGGLESARDAVEKFGVYTPKSTIVQKLKGADAFQDNSELLADPLITAAATPQQVKVTAPKQPITINNKLRVSGKDMAIASSTYKIEVNERAGFNENVYQNRLVLEQGARMVKR